MSPRTSAKLGSPERGAEGALVPEKEEHRHAQVERRPALTLGARRTQPHAHVNRPCSCGCDARLGIHGVGYLSGSDPAGNGFTLWIEDEAMYQPLAAMLGDRGHSR
jgi:hypothetical protein